MLRRILSFGRLPLPEKSFYEDMAQLENGVGMLRLLLSQADMALDEPEVGELVPFSVATGVSAAPFIDQILQKTKKSSPSFRAGSIPSATAFLAKPLLFPDWSPARTSLPS